MEIKITYGRRLIYGILRHFLIYASSKWIGADLPQSGAPDKRFCRCMWEIVEQRGRILLPRSKSAMPCEVEFEKREEDMRDERGGYHLHIDLRLFMMRRGEFALLSNLNASLNCHEPREGGLARQRNRVQRQKKIEEGRGHFSRRKSG